MNQSYLIAGSIVVGACIVAASILLLGRGTDQVSGAPTPATANEVVSVTVPSRSVPAYVYGSSDAEITITEFSDLECPFCARLHSTLKTLVDGSSGTIRWEYRHLPLPSHTEAVPAAIASECVGRALGDKAFFMYLDRLFAQIGSYSEALYRAEAMTLGMSEAAFAECVADPAVAALVSEDAAAASSLGARGTPFSVVTHRSGKSQVVSGAQPIANWQAVIDSLR